MTYKIQQSFSIILVLLNNPRPLFIACFRIIIVRPNHISRECTSIVNVSLMIRHLAPDKDISQFLPRLFLLQSDEQFIFRRIIVLGHCNRNHIIFLVRQTDAEIIRLNFIVACSWSNFLTGTDTIKQTTLFLAWFHIWIDINSKLVLLFYL